MAVLAVMASNPNRIKALIQNTKVNKAGIYLLKFYINGVVTPVIVDDYIPVYKGTSRPAFAHNREGKLWISLIEKGWAKLHGSYSLMEKG